MNKAKETKKSVPFFSVLLTIALLLTTLSACLTVTANAENTVPEGEWKDYAASAFACGTGTEQDPYLIATEEQLAKLSVDVAGGNAYTGIWFKLIKNLDLSAHRWNPIGQYRWEESSTVHNAFSGSFDGNGRTVRGIYVNEETDGFAGGLFGNIVAYKSKCNIEIRDINIENAVLYGNETGLVEGYSGILSAHVSANEDYSVLIKNINVSGSINVEYTSGWYFSGGICGKAARTTFADCTVENICLNGASNSGGFAGSVFECDFTDCIARGTVNGLWGIGGFVGYASLSDDQDADTCSTFTRCAADVDITASNWNVGGFCGASGGSVFKDCAAFGNVESTVTTFEPRVAGFLGNSEPWLDNYGPYHSVITDCYSGGTVKSAHPSIIPSAFSAGVTDDDVITGCCYDAEKNPNINVFSESDGTAVSSLTAEALSSDELRDAACEGLYGNHLYERNTCKICGLEHICINADGYWVIDGKVTDVKAEGEQGIQGEQGLQGLNGEKGDTGSEGSVGAEGNAASNGLAVTAVVIGGIALVSNMALVVYMFTEKKKRSENQ